MRERSQRIDILRGVAILMVMQMHMIQSSPAMHEIGVPVVLIVWLRYGWGGVDFFFVISAYLLTLNLLRHRKDDHFIRVFYLRRALRILPLYWIFLAAGFLTGALWLSGGGSADFWLWKDQEPAHVYLLFLQSWIIGWRGQAIGHFYGATWSLAVEETFYLILPLALYWLKPRQVGVVAACLIAAAPLVRLAFFHSPIPGASYIWIFAHMDAFGWGVLLAIMREYRADLLTMISARTGAIAAVCLTALVAPLATGLDKSTDWLLGISIFALAGAFAVWAAIHPMAFTSKTTPRMGRFLAWCGVRCYSLYLFHLPILGLIYVAAGGLHPYVKADASALLVAVAILLTFGFAALTYRFIELPCMALAARWAPYQPRSGKAAEG